MTATYDTLSTEALLEALEKAGRTPDRDLLTVCLGRRDDLVPGLLEMLRSGTDDDWENDDPRWYREVHAGLLLITFREERALPIFAEIFRDKERENLLEWFEPDRFAYYGSLAVDMLADLLRDRNAWVWGRVAAATRLEEIATRYSETRDRVVDLLRMRLPRVDAEGRFIIPPIYDEDHVEVWTWVMLSLAELKDTASEAQGVALYEVGMVETSIMGDVSDYRAIFESTRQRDLEPFDLVAFYHPAPRRPTAYELLPSTHDEEEVHGETGTVARTEKKVGRNDPCSCGSGRKYKRCCGR